MVKSVFFNVLFTIVICSTHGCSKEEIIINGSGPVPGGDYYVATWGNDEDPGTFEKPWASWQKAFNTADAGDIVYFRGGVWYLTEGIFGLYGLTSGLDGELGNPICFYNYPGETPILDLSKVHQSGNYITGLPIFRTNYVKFRGLTIRNVFQRKHGTQAMGIYCYGSSNISFENMTVHNIGGQAYVFFGAFGVPGYMDKITSDTTRFINCDAFAVCDSFALPGKDPATTLFGGIADGYKVDNERGAYIVFEGCRAWNCSDDGFDGSGALKYVWNNCWAFNNGYLKGGGEGIKNGFCRADIAETTVTVTNCVTAFNSYVGYHNNNNSDGKYYYQKVNMFNNIAYANHSHGFLIEKTGASGVLKDMVFRNNISYKNTVKNWQSTGLLYIESNNTWDRIGSFPQATVTDSVTVTDADFLSLIPRSLSGPRKADGSLPDINFLNLANDSDLKSSGKYVGMSEKPDIGIDRDFLKRK